MGREARAKRVGIPSTCYLCGNAITSEGDADLDHVPPKRWFPRASRTARSPQLVTLCVHKTCNYGYKTDEEYFFATLVGEAGGSAAGREAWEDLQKTFKDPEHRGLLRQVVGEFGKIELLGGRVARWPEWPRLRRVAWKAVRGLYFVDTGLVLPETTPRIVDIYPPGMVSALPPHFQLVRDTQSKGSYPAIFDYKTFFSEEAKLGYYALLLWDRIIILVPFHDSRSCNCEQCRPSEERRGT